MKPVLSLIILALGVLLYLEWSEWTPDIALPSVAPAAVSVQSAASVDAAETDGDTPLVEDLLAPPPSIEDYASVIERPLFLPNRRPPPDEPEQEPEPEAEEFSDLAGTDLTSVIITPEIVSAWVRGPKQRETLRLRIGDEYEGWTVKTIEPDKLTLERQGDTNEVVLRDYANAPAPIPPTRQPAPSRRQQQRREPATATRPDAGATPDAASENRRRQPDRTARRRAIRQRTTTTQSSAGRPPTPSKAPR